MVFRYIAWSLACSENLDLSAFVTSEKGKDSTHPVEILKIALHLCSEISM